MSKVKLFFNVTIVSGIILFVLELVAFLLFKDLYKENFGLLITNQDRLMFGGKLLAANIGVGLFIAVIFDTVYKALPGGFLRKGLNFALVLWGLEILPWVAHFYVAIDFSQKFLFLIMIQYIIIDLILGFVLTGLYDEFYLHIKGAELEKVRKQTEEVPKESFGEKVKKGWHITLKPKSKETAGESEDQGKDASDDDAKESEDKKEETEDAEKNDTLSDK